MGRGGQNSRPTFASRAKNRRAESWIPSSPVIVNSEFSIVPRVVPLAIFAAWHLVRSAFPSPFLLLSLFSSVLLFLAGSSKRGNAGIPRETGGLVLPGA